MGNFTKYVEHPSVTALLCDDERRHVARKPAKSDQSVVFSVVQVDASVWQQGGQRLCPRR